MTAHCPPGAAPVLSMVSHAPEVALQILLAGTGLWAGLQGSGVFHFGIGVPGEARSGFRPAADRPSRCATMLASRRASKRHFAATVYCRTECVAARLWIGQWGRRVAGRAARSTGRSELDQQVEKALHGLRLDGPPPAGFAQPVTIVIMPSDAALDCDNARRLPVRAGP